MFIFLWGLFALANTNAIMAYWSGGGKEFQYIYNGSRWKKTRAAYLSMHPLCEVCLSRGISSPASVVHHVEHLCAANVHDPDIVYGFANLVASCEKCHYEHHHTRPKTGGHFDFDEEGNVFQPLLERVKEHGKEEYKRVEP